MSLEINNIGVIFDISSDKFIADGAFYLIEDYNETAENKEKISLISSVIKDFFFEAKVNEMINEVTNNQNLKSVQYRNSEIIDFFEKRKDHIMDIIMMIDTGLKGTDVVNLDESSIIYLKITNYIKLGFYINKTMAKLIFKDIKGDVDGTII